MLSIITLLVISQMSEVSNRKAKSLPIPEISSENFNSIRSSSENLINPLSIHIALGQTQQQKTGIIYYIIKFYLQKI